MSTLGPYLHSYADGIETEINVILKEIGKGGYSVVMLAKHRETDDKVALKITPCDDLSADDETVIRNEINVMREIDHPHI